MGVFQLRFFKLYVLSSYRLFGAIRNDVTEKDCIHCFVRAGRFDGGCGPFNFPEVLKIFRTTIENLEKTSGIILPKDMRSYLNVTYMPMPG